MNEALLTWLPLYDRREAALGDGSFVARNGTVIEQSQILTTHNLAPVTAGLELTARVAEHAPDLARRILGWVVKEQNTQYSSWRSQLQMVKNTAYAWRQALFFLSLVDASEQRRAFDELKTRVADQPQDWQRRFDPVVAGLDEVLGGARFDDQVRVGAGRRYLGWSVGRHWLLSPDARRVVRCLPFGGHSDVRSSSIEYPVLRGITEGCTRSARRSFGLHR